MSPHHDDIPPLDPELASAIEGLSERIEPDRDLWAGIDAALDGEPVEEASPASSWLRPALVAAGIAMALAGGWLARDAGSEPAPNAPEKVAAAADPADQWGAELHEANVALLEQLSARDLSPEARDAIEANLITIDRAIRDVQEALDAHPGDPDLQRWLTDTQAIKKQVLISALHLPEGS